MTDFEFEVPRQKRLHVRLQLIGPGAAAFYRDACRLMALEPPLAGTTHIVGHLLREIESSLRYVLEPLQSREAQAVSPQPTEKAPKGRTGPRKDGHQREVRAALTALKFDPADPIAVAWLRLANKSEMGLHAWAHRDALSVPRPVDDDFRKLWDEVQGILDAVLDGFEANYARTMGLIDELVEIESPQDGDAKRFRNYVPQTPVALGYFFDRLQHPGWLKPLVEAGYLSSAPDPVEVEPGQIAFPRWPQGDYLLRVAGDEHARETVVQVLQALAPTRNVRVHRAFLDVLLLLPAQHAAPFVDRAIEWLDSSPPWFTPDRLGRLMVRLAEDGQHQAALNVASALFRVEPDARRDKGYTLRLPPESTCRYETARYAQLLNDSVAALAGACGISALETLCGLLDRALSLNAEPPRGNFPTDYSEIWRAAVEGHEQNSDRSVTSALVSAVRDVALQLPDWTASVDLLEALGWTIARRIALHVLRERLPDTLPVARMRVLDRRNFDDADLWHEYWLLAEECLPLMPKEDRASFFEWIDNGPDLERYAKIVIAVQQRAPSDVEVHEHVSRWTSKRLAAVRGALDDGRARQLAELSEAGGPPEHPHFDRYVHSRIGPVHMTKQEVTGLGDDELVALLQTWKPSDADREDTRAGLGRRISDLAAADPARFSRLSTRFRDLDPTYVRALLDGLWQVFHSTQPDPAISICIDWEAVLTLGEWVCERPLEPISRPGFGHGDPNWGWSRRSLVSLISRGLSDGPLQLPLAARERVWSALVVLLQDPDPSAADEVERGADPVEYARGTTRGQALHSVIKFALWLGRHDPRCGRAREDSQLLVVLPDVRTLLERHLRPEVEPSPSVHSVYGSRFHELLLIDRDWTTAQVPAIFCESPAPLGEAAWRGFMIAHGADPGVFELLCAQYKRALAAEEPVADHPSEYERDLATHVIDLFAAGSIELGDAAVLGRLFVRSTPARRRGILHSIGFRLGRTPMPLDDPLAARFEALWEWWRESVLRVGAAARELATFGWWFASGRLGDEWSLCQLEDLLVRGVPVEPDFKVVERLHELVNALPRLVLRCTSLLRDVWPHEWLERVGRQECEALLLSLLRHGDMEVARGAEALVNRLVACGHVELRTLLSSPG